MTKEDAKSNHYYVFIFTILVQNPKTTLNNENQVKWRKLIILLIHQRYRE